MQTTEEILRSLASTFDALATAERDNNHILQAEISSLRENNIVLKHALRDIRDILDKVVD